MGGSTDTARRLTEQNFVGPQHRRARLVERSGDHDTPKWRLPRRLQIGRPARKQREVQADHLVD
jgi:hypothetical protein